MDTSNEVLMQAVGENDMNLVTCFLSRGININKICSNGMTILGAAAKTGNLSLFKVLLDYHISSMKLDIQNENFCKPQFLQLDAVSQKRYKNIGYFVVCRDAEENEFGDGPTPDGMEALEWDMEVNESHFSADETCIEERDLNLYKWYANILNRTSLMLDSPERDIGRLDRHGQSVLHYAVNSGNIEMVEYILSMLSKELSVNQNDACCFSPLHIAAKGDCEMVRWLLKRGANVQAIGGRRRQSVLHVAARSSHLEIVKILVEAGADLNNLDIEERSVLTSAVRHGCEEMVKYLVQKGARVNHEEPGSVTALRLAVWANNIPVAKILLEGGARIIHSHHLVHTAVSNNSLEMVEMLVESRAILNVRNDQGYTPLMLSCSRKNISIARYLLAHGADPNLASCIDGKTVFHVCVQDVREPKSAQQLVELLVDHGADMNAISYQGTALFYSIILENRGVTSALVRHGADLHLKDACAYVDNLSLAKRHGDLELVRLLVLGGFRLSEMMWNPRSLRTQSVDPSCDFLVSAERNPLSLRELCRINVRKTMGEKRLIARIFSLPLPAVLQKYLALEFL